MEIESKDVSTLKIAINDIVDNIYSEEIREWVSHILYSAPEAFSFQKASREHHLPDEREDHGNLLHTIRVAKTVTVICDILNITGVQRDKQIAAAVIHDLRRYGLNDECDSSISVHPQLVRLYLLDAGIVYKGANRYDDDILVIVEQHMGKWGTPPIHLELGSASMILHLADCIEARLPEVLLW